MVLLLWAQGERWRNVMLLVLFAEVKDGGM